MAQILADQLAPGKVYFIGRLLFTGICSRTSAVAHAAEDFEFLADQSPLTLIEAKPMPRWLLLFSLLIVGVCLVVAIRPMRRA